MRADAPAIAAYRSHPDVACYQSWEAYSLDDAERLCAAQAENEIGTTGTWSQLAIVLLESGEVIGDCGLRFPGAGEPGHGTEVELGITLGAAHQGKGLASEAIACVVRLVFEEMGKEAIRASIDARNAPAAGLLARAGFARVSDRPRRAWFKGAWCDELDYVLRTSEADPTRAVSAAR